MTAWIRPDDQLTCRRCGEPVTFDYLTVVGPVDGESDEPVMRFNFSCREDPICYDVSFTTAKAIDPPDDWLPESFVQAMEMR